MTAVPTIVNLKFSGSSLISLNIKNKIITTDPIKTISWAKGTLNEPMPSVNITKIRLPPKIHQFTLVLSPSISSFNRKPCNSKILIFLLLK